VIVGSAEKWEHYAGRKSLDPIRAQKYGALKKIEDSRDADNGY
jgi:hypothetical protein